MNEAEEMAGIGVPFAAGVAAGALLLAEGSCPGPMAAAFLTAMILSLTALGASLRFRSENSRRIIFGVIFLLTGLFCSVNSAMTEGVPAQSGPIGVLAERCSERLKDTIDAIPYPSKITSPLVKALLTGERSGLDKETVGIFRSSGASHILALSGLHLGVIYLILMKLTRPLGGSRKARLLRYSFITGTSGFYAVMTGASPSIVRALLFILIGETARILGRDRKPARVLMASLTAQLALSPGVISSLGFQLSYLAMAGITFVYPHLERIYPKAEGGKGRLDPMRRIWQGAALSVSCQILTGPLVWIRFHSFPKYFILTNLVAMPLTSAVMVLSVAVAALSLMGICPGCLVLLDDKAVGALVYCLRVISSM